MPLKKKRIQRYRHRRIQRHHVGDFKYLSDNNIDLSRFPKTEFDNPPAERAVLFSSPGGLLRTVERYNPNASRVTRKIEGQPEIIHYLFHLPEARKTPNTTTPLLIDCLNCEMGCNGGPGTDNRNKHPDVVESSVERRAEEMRRKYAPKGEPATRGGKKRRLRKIDKILDAYWSPQLYHRSYRDRSAVKRHAYREPTQAEFEAVYRQTHKYAPEDFLNCGSCGYNSCEQMAFAIVNGLNRPENCRQYMESDLRQYATHADDLSRQLRSIAEESAQHLRHNLSDTSELFERAQQMSAAVEQSSSAVEEMVSQIQSVTKILYTNSESVAQLQTASEEGRSMLEEVTESIRSIMANSEAMVEASRVIQNIAEQTNLLSMNASIEAAHAGDAGRGFSVVAEEVRKLAEGSAEQARSIAAVLAGIKKAIEGVDLSSHETSRTFQKVEDLTSTVRNQEETIKNAVYEQGVGGKQVIEGLHSMRDLTIGVESSARSILQSSQSVLDQVTRLTQM